MTIEVDSEATLRLTPPVYAQIAVAIGTLGRRRYPELSALLPFTKGWRLEVFGNDSWGIARLIDVPGVSTNRVSQLTPEEAQGLLDRLPGSALQDPNGISRLLEPDWYTRLGADWYEQDRFTYIRAAGRTFQDLDELWKDIAIQLGAYLDAYLFPVLTVLHQSSIAAALPKPISYDLQSILPALWILECEETGDQGTAFALEGIGLVTCEHVLGTATAAFQSTDFTRKFPVSIVRRNEAIDLAVLSIPEVDLKPLKRGQAAAMKQLDLLAVIGFPNYRFGDSASIVTGQVAGFRSVSAVRRLLTNAPIIAGGSGGPVLDSSGTVIGVAVTGARRMEDAQATENHGIIPIEALDLFA